MKAVVLDFVEAEGTGTDFNMLLCGVEHVGHSNALQMSNVLHSLPIGYKDSIVHLVAADWPLFLPQRLSPESLKFFPWCEVPSVVPWVPLSRRHHLNRLLPFHRLPVSGTRGQFSVEGIARG